MSSSSSASGGESSGSELVFNTTVGLSTSPYDRSGSWIGSSAPKPSRGFNSSAILENLNRVGDDGAILSSLFELNEILSLGTEETLGNFPMDAFSETFCNLVNIEYNYDIPLLAARCVSHMLEVLPNSHESIFRSGLAPVLISKLMNISYIDLAEICLTCLRKLSAFQPHTINSSGGFVACLEFFNFFTIPMQKDAIVLASNICTSLTKDELKNSVSQLTVLKNLMIHGNDPMIQEKAILTFLRITDKYSSDKSIISLLIGIGITSSIMQIISIGSVDNRITPESMSLCIRIMECLCKFSVEAINSLINEGIIQVLEGKLMEISESPSDNRITLQCLYYYLCLINELLPNMPEPIAEFIKNSRASDTFAEPFRSPSLGRRRHKRVHRRIKNKKSGNENKLELYQKEPYKLDLIGDCLLKHLFVLYEGTVQIESKWKCLTAISKIVIHSPPESLINLLKDLSYSTFLAQLLSENDNYGMVSVALFMADDSMKKLPDIFNEHFLREGVVHHIDIVINRIASEFENVEAPIDVENSSSEEEPNYNSPSPHPSIIPPPPNMNVMEVEQNDSGNNQRDLEEARVMLHKLMKTKNRRKGSFKLHDNNIVESNNIILYQWIKENAIEFKNTYFDSEDISSPNLDLLSKLGKDLESKITCEDLENDGVGEILENIGTFLVGISSFEFSQSNILRSIYKYLTYRNDEESRGNWLKRVKIFINTFLNYNNGKESYGINLISCLNSILNEKGLLEEVTYLNIAPNSLLKMLNRPIKIHVRNDELEPIEFSTKFNIHPLATPEDIKANLINRINESSMGEISDISLNYDNKEIDSNLSIFNILFNHQREDVRNLKYIWDKDYEIYFRDTSENDFDNFQSHVDDSGISSIELLFSEIPICSELGDYISEIISLLYIIYNLNTYAMRKLIFDETPENTIPFSESHFINNNIVKRVNHQLRDPICYCSGTMVDWARIIPKNCPFMFPLNERKKILSRVSFGIARGINSWNKQLQDDPDFAIGRMKRFQCRIMRNDILGSAFQLLPMSINNRGVLEIEYFNEEGTGIGPTKEFFTLLSKEFQRDSLDMWISEVDDEYVFTKYGLYPKILFEDDEKTEDNFYNFGIFVSRALLDDRLIDVPLSVPFLKLLLGKKLTLEEDLTIIKPSIANMLIEMKGIIKMKHDIHCNDNLTDEEKEKEIQSITYKNTDLRELDIYFTLPGTDEELYRGSKDLLLTVDNVEEYVEILIDTYLNAGISRQISAFTRGFNSNFPMNNLKYFNIEDLENILCGEIGDFSRQAITEHMVIRGYSIRSEVVQWLLEAMSNFDEDEKKVFLQFLTGCKRLPVGGWKKLPRKFTISPSELHNVHPDSALPSASTCFLFLKIPEYSSQQIFDLKLRYAMYEGMKGFARS
eukprot:TRINITY_DN9483_c0_g1_i1.p1 TRINITY_DN9483_c0_g1~~TRINITY_DN9483_c0_g1_i1.p1  ORF type:complete len:1458 (-),score=344.31 TRINITY_DN9483_c0_g1_i1:125-4306(-)